MTNESPGPGVGRPPGPHSETLQKILPVVFDLFLAEGGAALTPNRLHAETGVSRTTIYRNWPEPEDLIEAMLARVATGPPGPAPTGDLSADLTGAIDALLHRIQIRPARAFFAACLEYGRRSERVAHAGETFIESLLSPIRAVVENGLARGDIALQHDDESVETLMSDLVGPMIFDFIVLGRQIPPGAAETASHRFVERYADSP